MMRIDNANHIHAALRAQGLTCRSWALAHGYHPRTVLHCIRLFSPDTGRKPKRPHAKEIVKALSLAIGFDLMQGEGDE